MLSMALLHSLHQDDQNDVQHDVSGHVISMVPASASHDAMALSMAPLHSLSLDKLGAT